MGRMARLTVAALLLSSGACLCVGDDDGDLTIFYLFEGAYCDDAGVGRIQVAVEGLDVNDSSFQDVSCAAFLEGLTIHDLREGEYRLDLEGVTAGVARYGLHDLRVEVRSGVNEYDFDVPALLGDLTIFWEFEGSPLCGEVVDLRVIAIDPDGFLWDDAHYPCDWEGVIYDAVPTGTWTVSLDALDDCSRIVYSARDVQLEVLSGQDNTWVVDLPAR